MVSAFKKHVLEEIEEVEEIAFFLLIPIYLEKTGKADLEGDLLTDFQSNYNISESDFSELYLEVENLINLENLAIYRYHDTSSTERKDYLRPLKKYQQNKFLKEKSNWIFKKEKPTYFLCKKK